MTELFKRRHEIVVGTVLLTDVRVTFNVVRSLKREANKASISIWNLNEDHRQSVSSQDQIPVSISAGYENRFSRIFLGNLDRATSVLNGPDIVTTLESGDGKSKMRSTNISKSYPRQTPVKTIISDLAKAIGIGTGNLEEIIATAKLPTADTQTITGVAVFGNASRELRYWLDSLRIEWSIQDGALQLLKKRDSLKSEAIRLTPDTGLIGSPSVDNKGKLSATALLIPDLEPGRVVVVDSRFVSGAYRIEQTTYVGDTLGGDWLAQIEGQEFKVKT